MSDTTQSQREDYKEQESYQYTGRMIVSLKGQELLPLEKEIIVHPNTAGIILFTRNYSSRSQLIKLLSEIQYIAVRAGKKEGVPVFVDQEGGFVQRLGRGFTIPLPCPAIIGMSYDLDKSHGLRFAMECGKLMAAPLKEMGITSLAPVLDLQAGNTVIEGLGRAFHKNPNVCAELAEAYIDGMISAGMFATGKHFPGHGQNIGDSHVTTPVDSRALEQIEEQDLVPFICLIRKRKLAAIMPAHITYTQIDPDNTAGMSKILLANILRKKYGFNGIIVSDCLAMQGAGSGSYLIKTIQALQYGDIALLCNLEPSVLLGVLKDLDSGYYMSLDANERFHRWVDSSKDDRIRLASQYKSLAMPNVLPAFTASTKEQGKLCGSVAVTDLSTSIENTTKKNDYCAIL